jgi:RimJ/RimL family protein N-acetyltransferase
VADAPKTAADRVSIARIDARNREAAVRLEVADEHLPYVSPVAEMLAVGDGATEDYAILAGGTVVGFFRLDFDRARVSRYAGEGRFCGLRGYLIGRRYQGLGYGRAAIPEIRRLTRERHPDIDRLVLTVNRRNAAAISTYLKAGFRGTGRMYHGGASGPQYVFALPLNG